MGKRYYWLKLKDDFFRQLPMKKLRRIAGGDTYTIIYLKMMLVTTKTDGVLGYDCSEEEFIENLALDIDEDEQNVKVTVQFLIANGLLVPMENGDMLLPEAKEAIGSEGASALRMRQLRERKASQCDKTVTPALQNSYGEIEKEIEIEIEKDNTTDVVVSKDSRMDAYYFMMAAMSATNVLTEWETIIGTTITPYLAEQIKGLCLEVGVDPYIKALKKAAKMNKRNFRYIETVARGIAAGDDFDEKKNTNAGAIDWDDVRKRCLGEN